MATQQAVERPVAPHPSDSNSIAGPLPAGRWARVSLPGHLSTGHPIPLSALSKSTDHTEGKSHHSLGAYGQLWVPRSSLDTGQWQGQLEFTGGWTAPRHRILGSRPEAVAAPCPLTPDGPPAPQRGSLPARAVPGQGVEWGREARLSSGSRQLHGHRDPERTHHSSPGDCDPMTQHPA